MAKKTDDKPDEPKVEEAAAPAKPKYQVSVPGHTHAKKVYAADSERHAIEQYKTELGIYSFPAEPLAELQAE